MPKPDYIKVELRTVGGKEVIDIRRCIKNGKGFIPTSKGLSLPPSKLQKLIDALRECGESSITVEL
ncbi:hypothetical protein LCGC14_0840020 [marine sediment metagenome]|uniref:Transcriptional coactivator p15 (PC4) C-terminal domain-containing protein n=1 Tax=marine sediment metagenome TaxID=412755 RepID=A0A0F9PI42_9ZZZZ